VVDAPSKEERLEIRLFGRVNCTFAGEPWPLRVSKGALTLLAYLLLNRKAPVSRDFVAFKLWKDDEEEKARSNLRRYLNELKSNLPKANVEWIRADRRDVQWNPGAGAWLDVAEFEGSSEEDTSRLEASVELYRGDLLEGDLIEDPDGDWLEPARRQLRAMYAARLRLLIERGRAAGNLKSAIGWAERLLALDEFDEWAIRELLLLHHAAGDKASANRLYTDTIGKFEDSGLAPSEATLATYQRVMATEVPHVSAAPRLDAELRDNIPAQLTPFIGRAAELLETQRLLGATRLLTLAGTGGVGKTRLAVQFANDFSGRFPDGRWFVDFGPLNDKSYVPTAILSALGLHEEAGRDVLDTVIDHLRGMQALIVFDNCEHVIGEVASSVERLLHECPKLVALATSREVLRVPGEVVYRIQTFGESESLELFNNRAVAANPSFVLNEENELTIKHICRRVEGIPLAIELAAAWVRMMTVEELWRRLDDRFRILTGGSRTALPRQQTLHGLIGWSYNLLADCEKIMLRRLGVFSGEFSMESATAVCAFEPIAEAQAMELISALIDKSLVSADQGGAARRYRMLESTKAYALERLDEAGEWDAVQRRHARYFLALAEAAERHHGTPAYDVFREQTALDYGDFRAVLERNLQERGDVALAAALAAALARYWMERGLSREGRAWLERVVEHEAGNIPLRTLAMALLGLVGQYYVAGEYALMGVMAARAADAYGAVDDAQGQARARLYVAVAATYAGDYERAENLYTSILATARGLDDRRMEAVALQNLAEVITLGKRDHGESVQLYAQAVAIHRERGDSRSLSTALGDWSETAADSGDFARAHELASESLELCRQIGDQTRIIEQMTRIGRYSVWSGQPALAAEPLHEAVGLLRGVMHPLFFARCVDACVDFALARSDAKAAAVLLGFNETWRATQKLPRANVYQALNDAASGKARDAIGEADFAAALAAGGMLAPEGALDVMEALTAPA
jgi:predicted ATPase/DNA-binding SARP family transcriptional activator